jgi:hypothetical protein
MNYMAIETAAGDLDCLGFTAGTEKEIYTYV